MTYERNSKSSYDAAANGRKNHGESGSAQGDVPRLDTNLQSHLGRTLRRVYEAEGGSSIPQDLVDLLEKLDAVHAGTGDKSACRTS
ncbi:hypothetical protein ACSSVZ_004421 [Amorphus sp. MBR-141]